MRFSSIILLVSAVLAAADSGASPQKCPPAPGEPGWLEDRMQAREDKVAVERRRAIGLLNGFLAKYPRAPERANALFRLAELYWESSEADFLHKMQAYDAQIDAFRSGALKVRPPEPRIDLARSIGVYEQILEKHQDFDKSDIVLYLYGFGLNEQGNEQAALSIYRTLIKKYPKSAFMPDAHLAIGEYLFSKGGYAEALRSYGHVLEHPGTPLEDLALYKTAWCYFKLGKAKQAARRFKRILYHADEPRRPGGRVNSATELKKEALEDLALTFSESGGAREAYRFMKQVGGEKYSISVLHSLGEVFFRQARYTKAIESYRMLVDKFPFSAESPAIRVKIAEAYERAGLVERALVERRAVATNYGPGSSWARKNAADTEATQEARRLSEESLRYVALYRHKQAQKSHDGKAYQASAAAYSEYLAMFPESAQSPRMHFFLGEVLFKLKNFARAAENYLLAVRKLKDTKLRVEAAYAAVLSFDALRKKSGLPGDEPHAVKQSFSKSEQGFSRAVDEFARLAPGDKKVPQLRFEQGKTCYYHAHFRRAAQRFLSLVQNHPQDAFAPAAADLALDCYTRLGDWATLEKKARRFKRHGTFTGKELDSRLPEFIAAAIFQSGAALAKKGKPGKAAREYERMASEFPKSDLAPKALFWAAVNHERAGQKEKAIDSYRKIIKRYPKRAAEATFVMAGIYERKYDYDRAAANYEKFAAKFPKDTRAPSALLQAALLHRARRAYSKEAASLQEFTKSYPKHKKASEALFGAGLAFARAGKPASAEQIFASYSTKFAKRDRRVRQAALHLGQVMQALGKLSSARRQYDKCGSFPLRRPPKGPELAAAAQCLFLMGEMVFSSYQKIELRPPKARLVKLLGKKAALLKKAEGMFTRVVAAGDMEWASAALYRIGDMYARFAQAIYKAPMPKGLSAAELDVYRNELQSLAFPIEDKAQSAFSISHAMAIKHAYYSQWSEKTLKQLRMLDPGRFPAEDEIRPGTAWADSFTTFPLIIEKMKIRRRKAGKAGKP